jgi:hypothetical protein
LVAGGHDVRRPDVALDETFAVKIREGVQHVFEYRPSFLWRQRPLQKNLRKVFLRTLHHKI